MSILFALVTFLLFVTISYLRSTRTQPGVVTGPPELAASPKPQILREAGFDFPKGYGFHPGHTWALPEDGQNVRIGLDSFGANLLGKIERVELPKLNRWVRQGQPICKVGAGDVSVDLVAPIEGVVTAVNTKLLEDPGAIGREPYGEGWLVQVQSPDLHINLRNLLQDGVVRPWMRNSLERVAALASGFAPALAQDGGVPVPGVLTKVEPTLQRLMINEFFLT